MTQVPKTLTQWRYCINPVISRDQNKCIPHGCGEMKFSYESLERLIIVLVHVQGPFTRLLANSAIYIEHDKRRV
jgi:hypothetical protein